jgi:hypothetical protein
LCHFHDNLTYNVRSIKIKIKQRRFQLTSRFFFWLVFCSFLDQVGFNRFFAKKKKNQSPGLCEIRLTFNHSTGSRSQIPDRRSTSTRPLSWNVDVAARGAWLRVAARGCAWLRVAARGCAWLRVAARGCAWLRVLDAAVRIFIN